MQGGLFRPAVREQRKVRGRKPRPAELRLIEGNPGRRPIPRPLKVPPGLPAPPGHLDPEALAEWHRIIGELGQIGIITQPDRAALAAYCCAYSRWALAEKRLREQGQLTRNAAGSVVQSPWMKISTQAMLLMHKFLTEFGMTPVSRSRVTAASADDPTNPFALIG